LLLNDKGLRPSHALTELSLPERRCGKIAAKNTLRAAMVRQRNQPGVEQGED
jgi:hypothetical protein